MDTHKVEDSGGSISLFPLRHQQATTITPISPTRAARGKGGPWPGAAQTKATATSHADWADAHLRTAGSTAQVSAVVPRVEFECVSGDTHLVGPFGKPYFVVVARATSCEQVLWILLSCNVQRSVRVRGAVSKQLRRGLFAAPHAPLTFPPCRSCFTLSACCFNPKLVAFHVYCDVWTARWSFRTPQV